MKPREEIRYFAYCRKSSEDSQRQIASIGDQEDTLAAMAEREGLVLVAPPFTEERSAKDPGRKVFNDMLDRIERGEANALMCWDIDRLHRNPLDEGRVRWMLQNSFIKVIRTPYRQFYPEDAGLLMGVEGGRATDYVIRLSKNVKRGLNSKANRGWRPTGCPIGYLNDGLEKGNKTIIPDPERFDLVRRMWDLFLTGNYSVANIRELANNEWGLRTIQHRKVGGQPLAMSQFYRIFNDTFYYGYFPWVDPESGEENMIHGKHVPMITEAEFNRAQVLLGKKGKPRPKTREFAFTGLMHCGECDSMITAEEKNQLICKSCKHKFAYENKTFCPKCQTDISEMTNPTILHYVYYRCTKKKNRKCGQKTVRLEKLEEQFEEVLKDITIDEDYLKLALDYLQDKQQSSGDEESTIHQSLEAALSSCKTRLTNLSREFTSPLNTDYSLYSPEEFKSEKAALITEINGLESQMSQTKQKLYEDLEASERVFNFCAFALKNFDTDDLKAKRAIFDSLGSNLRLTDRKLSIDKLHPYVLIQNQLNAQKQLYAGLEPESSRYIARRKAVFASTIPDWLRTVEAVRTHFLSNCCP